MLARAAAGDAWLRAECLSALLVTKDPQDERTMAGALILGEAIYKLGRLFGN